MFEQVPNNSFFSVYFVENLISPFICLVGFLISSHLHGHLLEFNKLSMFPPDRHYTCACLFLKDGFLNNNMTYFLILVSEKQNKTKPINQTNKN